MPPSGNFLAWWTVLHSLAMLMIEPYGAFAGVKDPLVLWTEQSHIWSKIRGIEGPPQTWIPTRYKPFVHTETAEKFRYAIGYNQQSNELLWSDKVDKGIYRQPITDAVEEKNLNNISPVLTGTSAGINGLAVDWLAGNVYFTDGEKKMVAVAPLAASRADLHIVLHRDNVSNPTGIAVDPYKGKLFWSDAESGRLETSSTGGQSREVIVSNPRYVSEPVGLTIDYSTETIYFLDRSKQHIVSCNYEGDNVQILHTAEDQGNLTVSFFSISFWTEYLYVSTKAGLHLHVYNRTSGSLLETLDLDANIYDIIVPKEHDSPDHECDDLDCQQICLNVGERKGVCACTEDYYLEMDGRSCSERKAWFIYSIGEKIYSTKVRAETSQPELLFVEEQLVKDNQDLVKALGFSYNDRTLFFSDTAQCVIYRGDPDGGVSSAWKELTVNTGEVEGIAVDWMSKNVYWTDKELGHIMVSHLDGRYHKILLGNIGEPLGVAVDPHRGYLYWVSQETDTSAASIFRARLDGTERGVFVDTDLSEPQGLVVDVRKHRLYWTDKGHREINYIGVISKERQRVISRLSSRLHDVAVFLEYTTWTNGGDGLQFMMEGEDDTLDSDNLNLADGEKFNRSFDVVTYGTYLQPEISSSRCGDDNGGCQQLCFSTPDGFACACAIGYTMKADGVSCKSDSVAEEFVLYTDPYHKQIYQSSMSPGTEQTHGVPVPPMQFPICADYDSGDGRLYWLDVETSAIMSADMAGQDVETVISISGNIQPQRLATDPTSKNLFYSTGDAIYKVNKDSGKVASFVTGIQMTTALVVDSTTGWLYWAEEGSPTLIRQFTTESAAPSTVLELEHPVSSISVIGEDGMIYYSVKEEGTIKSFNVSTQSTTVLFSDKDYHIISISASLKYLYFTTWNKRGVYRITRDDGRDFTVIGRPIFARLTDVRAYDSRIRILPARPVESEEGLPIAIIAGVAAGVLLLLLLLLVGVLVACRRGKSKASAAQRLPTDEQDDAKPVFHEIDGEATHEVFTAGGEDTPYGDDATNGNKTESDVAGSGKEVGLIGLYTNTTCDEPPLPSQEEVTPNGDATTNRDGDDVNVLPPLPLQVGEVTPNGDATTNRDGDDVSVLPPLPLQEGEATPIGNAPTNDDSKAIGAANPDGKDVYQSTPDDVLPPLPPSKTSHPDERATLPQDLDDVTLEVQAAAEMTAIGPERGEAAPDDKRHNQGRPMSPASRSVPSTVVHSR